MSDEYKLIGEITCVYDDSPAGRAFYFQIENSQEFVMLVVEDAESLGDSLLNSRVEVTLVHEGATIKLVSAVHKPKPAPAFMFTQAVGDALTLRKIHVGLFRQVAVGTSEEEIATQLAITKKHARKIQDLYRNYYRHVADVQVRGYVMEGSESTHPPTYARHDIDNYINTHDMDGFVPNYFSVHGGTSSSYCGQGNVGGNRCTTYLSTACGTKTMIHELGHNLGLHHAGSLSSSGVLSEYGDTNDYMGKDSKAKGFGSVALYRLGLESVREVRHIPYTQQVYIAPVEMNRNYLRPNEYQVIKFSALGKSYHITLRKVTGSRYNNDRDYTNPTALVIHEYTRDRKSILQSPTLYPGQIAVVDGVTVDYLEYDDESARVNVVLSPTDSTPDNLPDQDTFPTHPYAYRLQEWHAGVWHDPECVGQGIDLYVSRGRALMYWYTFNLDDNSRRFYYATWDLNDKEFDIYTTRGGTWADPKQAVPEKIGKGQLFFPDAGNGIFNFTTYEHGRGSIELTPVMRDSQDPANGAYYNPKRDGEGISARWSSDGEYCSAFWFTYGPDMIPWGNEAIIQTQRWFTCQGSRHPEFPNVYLCTVYEILDGEWTSLSETTLEEVGTVSIKKYPNNDKVLFSFSINAEGIAGKRKAELEKLF